MQSVRHPNRAREGLRATERALMRWHPGLSLRFIDAIHAKVPDYPLIHGGSPRLEFFEMTDDVPLLVVTGDGAPHRHCMAGMRI